MKNIYIEYLNIPIEIGEPDEWVYLHLVRGQYRVHYCEKIHEMYIYEYEEILDKYTLLTTQIV